MKKTLSMKEMRFMQKQYSIAEAKNKLPAIIHQVEKGPFVELTRRGKPVVVLLSIDEFKRLNLSSSGFWKALTAFRETLNSEGTVVLNQDFEGLRDTSPGREVDLS